MTKRLLKVALLLCGVAGATRSTQAQTPNPNARIGVMGGVNLSTFSDVDDADLTNRVGLLAGLSYTRPRPGSFGFEMDLLYSAKGAKSKDGNDEITFKLDYVELPVLLRYDFASTGGVRPHLAIGPSLALRARCSGEGTGGGATVSIDCDELQQGLDVKFKSFDVGATAGGGLDFAVGRNTFTVGARYTMGLVSIVKDDSSKNRAFSLYAGISMPLRR